jgi:hypothetical protein
MKCRMDIRQLAQEAFFVVLSLIVAGGLDCSYLFRIHFYASLLYDEPKGGFGALHQH